MVDDEEVGSRKVEVVQHVESGFQFLSYQFETVNCIPLSLKVELLCSSPEAIQKNEDELTRVENASEDEIEPPI